MSTPELANLSPAAAAAWLGVSKTTVRLMLKEHRLPFSRIGRRIIIRLADLQALLDATRVEPDRESACANSRSRLIG
jgi:excisionase family DNA binding protein